MNTKNIKINEWKKTKLKKAGFVTFAVILWLLTRTLLRLGNIFIQKPFLIACDNFAGVFVDVSRNEKRYQTQKTDKQKSGRVSVIISSNVFHN